MVAQQARHSECFNFQSISFIPSKLFVALRQLLVGIVADWQRHLVKEHVVVKSAAVERHEGVLLGS